MRPPYRIGVEALAGLLVLVLVAFVRYTFEERFEFQRPLHAAVEIDRNSGVRVLPPIRRNAMPHSLPQRVLIRPPALFLVANSAVEVIAVTFFAPKRDSAFRQRVVHELRHRAVDALHYRTEILTDA